MRGKEGKEIHTHTHGNGWMRCAAMQRNGKEMGRDFAVAVVVSSFFLLLLFERARLIGAAAIAGC